MPKKILVVEDDDINRKLFVSLLEGDGYEVSEAAEGQAAIRLITLEAFSLVLMDIGLPTMSGAEVLRTCKEKGLLRGTKVYALTASAGTARESGFDGIITKPIRVREFLRTVGEILRVREEEREEREN